MFISKILATFSERAALSFYCKPAWEFKSLSIILNMINKVEVEDLHCITDTSYTLSDTFGRNYEIWHLHININMHINDSRPFLTTNFTFMGHFAFKQLILGSLLIRLFWSVGCSVNNLINYEYIQKKVLQTENFCLNFGQYIASSLKTNSFFLNFLLQKCLCVDIPKCHFLSKAKTVTHFYINRCSNNIGGL